MSRLPTFFRPQRVLFVVLVLLFVTSLCVATLRFRTALPDIVVTRTASGFVPDKVLIKKGQAVIFKDASGKEFWPASDFHPTHSVYPEFDPKVPVPAGGTWRFVFQRAGVWTYHDHLAENAHGTVIVTGAPGESSAECIKSAGSGAVKAVCWQGDILDVLRSKGLQAAFDEFKKLYATVPEFRGLNCHDAGHFLGAAAYKEYRDDHTVIDRPETSYCGYGFYHGFIEAMTVEEGPGQFQKIRDYCDSLKTGGQLNDAAGPCYHGIGHAVFDSLPGDVWGDDGAMVRSALNTCRVATRGEPERLQCGTGVFNSLANAYSAHSYRLSFPVNDPMQICRIQSKDDRSGCYREVGIGVIRDRHMSRAESIRFIRTLGDADATATTLLGYAGDEAKRSINNPDVTDLQTLCLSFNTEVYRELCIQGVIRGMREAGEPGKEYVLMFRYCALYPKAVARNDCYSFAILQTRAIAADTSDFENACMAIEDADVRGMCK